MPATTDIFVAGVMIILVIAMILVNLSINKSMREQIKQQGRLIERYDQTITKWTGAYRALQGQFLAKHTQWSAKNARLRRGLLSEKARAEGYKAMLTEVAPHLLPDEVIDSDDEVFEVGSGPLFRGEIGSVKDCVFIGTDQVVDLVGSSPIVGANGESLPGKDLRDMRPESELWVGGQRVA